MKMQQEQAPVPLCLKHDEPMRASAELNAGYACAQPGCNCHYTLRDGYFELVGRNMKSEGTRICTECHAVHLYLAKRGDIKMEDLWLCPNKTCLSKA